ncbi:RNF19A [Branchiostoma lanceolatum]|uniref:RNF19A protein n=1 Tax=Branchiostoma lanceolatum TaxID=7740 RepID=A0A8K0EDX9_BRALA|nr:RNF19A [Branchiostoma lanceolatum]
MARQQRTNNLRSSSVSHSQVSAADDIKPCPRCGAYIVKMDDGSCNHMTCAVCGAEFCWLCMKEISDLHYLSPSGCTFWGKKPWSRKKKILWQLGTLVGAPVGIALIASISLPAMIIGIPVYMGRKIHNKYENLPPHRRHLAVTGGVSLSILVAPVLAALTVGIGVPIMLAYVYGVVPISLCRSGGCGVRTTQKGGVRFEFDDDNEANVGAGGAMTGENGSMDHSLPGKEGNPSIGEGSLLSVSNVGRENGSMDHSLPGKEGNPSIGEGENGSMDHSLPGKEGNPSIGEGSLLSVSNVGRENGSMDHSLPGKEGNPSIGEGENGSMDHSLPGKEGNPSIGEGSLLSVSNVGRENLSMDHSLPGKEGNPSIREGSLLSVSNVGRENGSMDHSLPGKEGNPSIGEGSLLSASSSQVERLGVLRDSVSDRDSASTMAIAGSLAGSTGVTTNHRLEVQADVQRKRCSVSSESPSASLGDNASTVAMAGSLLNGIGASSYTLGGAVAGATIQPLEVAVDLGGAVAGATVDLAEKPKSRHSSGGSSSVDNLQDSQTCRATSKHRGSHRRSKVRGQEGRGQDKVRGQGDKVKGHVDSDRKVWSREESERRTWSREESDRRVGRSEESERRVLGRDGSDADRRAWTRDSCGSSCPSPSISLCSTTDSHCSRTDSHYSEGSLAMSHTDTSSRGSAAAMSHTDTSSRGSAAAMSHTDTSSRGSAAAMSHTDTSSRGSAAAMSHTDTSSRGSAAAMSHTDTSSRGSAAAMSHTDTSSRGSAKLDSSSHSYGAAMTAKTDTLGQTSGAGMSAASDASSRDPEAACVRSVSPLTEVENDRPDVFSPAPARVVSFPSETQSLGHILEEREMGGGDGQSGFVGGGEGLGRRRYSMEEPSSVHTARQDQSSL